MKELLEAFIKDVHVESMKFRLQTSRPHSDRQRNNIMGNFDFNKLDGKTVGDTLSEEITHLKRVTSLSAERLLPELLESWVKKRTIIQYAGYGYGEDSMIRRGKAYSYILLSRILKSHTELLKMIYKNRKVLKI